MYQEVAQFLILSCHNQKLSVVLIEIWGYGMLSKVKHSYNSFSSSTSKWIEFKLSLSGEQIGSTFAESIYTSLRKYEPLL